MDDDTTARQFVPFAEPQNIVTLRLPAGLYAALLAELVFASSICGGEGRSQENARTLAKMLYKQGGMDLTLQTGVTHG